MVLHGGRNGLAWCMVLWASLVAQGAGAEAAKGVHLLSQEADDARIGIVLGVEAPSVKSLIAKDSNTYSRVRVAGCGADNTQGRPELPIIPLTVEVPWGTQVQATVTGSGFEDLQVKHWVFPHQPPHPKVAGPEGNPPFALDEAYYGRAASKGFQRAKGGEKATVFVYRKRGKQYADLLIRPFEYDCAKGLLRFPRQLAIELSLKGGGVPKAAGPRLGSVRVVEVSIADARELEVLTARGFNIASRHGALVTIYASKEETKLLEQMGYRPRRSPHQEGPRPGLPGTAPKTLGTYHDYAALTTALEGYAQAYPDICRKSSLGQSVEGRELWAVKITDNPDTEEDEPEVKYVSTMHGDEPVGTEMCLYFIDMLLAGYGTDTRITRFVDETELWIVPLMNPDGREAGTRSNADGYDLNRSFPEGAETPIGNVFHGPAMETNGLPREVGLLMEWSGARRFVLSANFHTGALVCNYPYDNDGLGSVSSPAPDDGLFQFISLAYARLNAPMYASSEFPRGITNGAAWYAISGGMQDWNYRYLGCNEITIELSNRKWPSAAALPGLWEDNEEAMLACLETAQIGVRGVVTDAASGLPVHAEVRVADNTQAVYTDPDVGDYHRMLLPGSYTLEFRAPGYAPMTFDDVVVAEGAAARLDVQLEAGTAHRGGLVLVSNESMAEAVAEFKAQKEDEGFSVYEVAVGDNETASQIREAIRAIYAAESVRYLIIIGDVEDVPAFSYNGSTSDLLYSLMDDGEDFADYLGRDLIAGRIALDGGAQLANYTAKLSAFTSGTRHGHLTWVSNGNNSSEYDVAEGTHDYVMDTVLPTSFTHETFYRNEGSGTELSAQINAGTDMLIYSGHGGTTTWSRYDYGISDVQALNNPLDAPVVIGHCCVTGSYGMDMCFAEAWIPSSARGIVYIGASNNTMWDEDDILEKVEFQAMIDTPGLPIGDGLVEGLLAVHEHYPGRAEYYHGVYHIFGDPTVQPLSDGALAIAAPAALPLAFRGEVYEFSFGVFGGAPPFAWEVIDGALPDGLSLHPETALVSGSPSSVGSGTVTLQVTDATDAVDEHTCTWNVLERLLITTPSLPGARWGQAYAVSLAAEGGTAPHTWQLTNPGTYEESGIASGWQGGGTAQDWNGDDGAWALTLPWAFPFYGEDYTTVYVSSNGFIDLGAADSAYENTTAALRGRVRIAPLWDDLRTDSGDSDVYVRQDSDAVLIRWDAVTFNTGSPVNVEAVLYRNGNIDFNYGAAHSALSPTVGVSSGDGQNYLVASLDGASSIPANTSLRFSRAEVLPEGITLSEDGLLGGTPTQTGDFTISLAVRDSGEEAQRATADYALRISQGEGELEEAEDAEAEWAEAEPAEGQAPEAEQEEAEAPEAEHAEAEAPEAEHAEAEAPEAEHTEAETTEAESGEAESPEGEPPAGEGEVVAEGGAPAEGECNPDAEPPRIVSRAPRQAPLLLGLGCETALPDYRDRIAATDNCGEPQITQSPAPGTPIAEDTTVILTATDGAGLTDTCQVAVAVVAGVCGGEGEAPEGEAPVLAALEGFWKGGTSALAFDATQVPGTLALTVFDWDAEAADWVANLEGTMAVRRGAFLVEVRRRWNAVSEGLEDCAEACGDQASFELSANTLVLRPSPGGFFAAGTYAKTLEEGEREGETPPLEGETPNEGEGEAPNEGEGEPSTNDGEALDEGEGEAPTPLEGEETELAELAGELLEAFSSADQDSDGSLDLEEAQAVLDLEPGEFTLLDTNSDAKLSLQELEDAAEAPEDGEGQPPTEEGEAPEEGDGPPPVDEGEAPIEGEGKSEGEEEGEPAGCACIQTASGGGDLKHHLGDLLLLGLGLLAAAFWPVYRPGRTGPGVH